MDSILNVQARSESGKKYSKKLRKLERLPAVFYIRGEDTIPLSVDRKEFLNLMSKEVTVVNLQFDDKNQRECVIREVQFDPVSSQPIHIDFLGFKRGEKIDVVVPIHLEGTPIGVKEGGGILQQITREVDVQCLPRDIPEHLSVDVSALNVGDSVHMSNLQYENITILSEPERVVATIIAPKVAEEVTEVPLEAEEGAEPEVVGKTGEEEEQEENS